MNFIQLAANGRVKLNEIDDFIDRWHHGDSKLGLPEFLGMSEADYARWVKNPDALAAIVHEYRWDQGIINAQWFKEEAINAFMTFFMPVTLPWVLLRHGPKAAKDHFLEIWNRR